MKKLLSILLITALFLSLPCLQASASTPVSESYSLTENEKGTTLHNDLTIIDEFPSNPKDCDSILSTDTVFSQNQSFEQASIHFNETSETFLQKITSDTLSIDGYATNENSQSISLTDYFTQNKASRFDIVDIAFQDNLITETEKIEAYCSLYENWQFENITCLHKVITTLSQYQLSENTSNETNERIQSIFSPSSNTLSRSVEEYDAYPSYSSTNFIVRYEPGIAYSEAVKVANYLETVRNIYVNEMGYRTPIAESTQPKYRVVLLLGESKDDDVVYPTNDPYPAAGVIPDESYGVRSSSRIEIYYFSSFSSNTREILAHELYHAIQKAYYTNGWPPNSWLSESTACWATVMIGESTTVMNEHINGYLSSTLSLLDSDEMGTVLFPFVMQHLCGTSNVIREMWEELGNLNETSIVLRQLRNVIDTTLAPYEESFDSIFLTMGYYNFSPSYWYSSFYPEGSSATDTWIPRIDTTTNTDSRPRELEPRDVLNSNGQQIHHIEAHSHQYHKFIPDKTGQNSKIVIEIEYVDNEQYTGTDPSKGWCYFYYVKADGTQNAIQLPKTGPNKYVYVSDTYGGDILWCGIIVSNTSYSSQQIFYTLKYHVERGTEQTLSLASNLRYYEKVENIDKGEYIDYHVTFATGGNKLIQTFGTKNTYIELYDGTTNELLASNDNDGVGLNAMISYSFTENKHYRIRLMFSTQPVSGETKFVIIPTTAYSTFEDIQLYTDYTSNITGTYTLNETNLIRYKSTTEQTRTLRLQSNIDSYLYIINPRSTDPITRADNTTPTNTQNAEGLYNDDYNSTTVSQLTKTLLANKEYIIIVCKYNPSNTTNGSYTLSFN